MIGATQFNLESKALAVCEQRAIMLAKNIANSATPNYKARDLNFYQAMQESNLTTTLSTTNNYHLANNQAVGSEKPYFRVPMQVSMDGNTVDDDIERKNFVDNALRYQANISFAQNKAATLLKAIKGD